jgi:hypothetical protein
MSLFVRSLFAFGMAAVSLPLAAQQKVSTTASSVVLNTPQFLWFTSQNALRFGTVSSTTPWGTSNLGSHSLAFGSDAKASGYESFAFGQNTQALGAGSFAFGPNTQALGYFSFAFGQEAVANHNSIAMGDWSYASNGAVAIGYYASAASSALHLGGSGWASGGGSIALGESFATAPYSFSAVYCGAAYGFGSVGIGVESWAAGDYSVSLGAGAYAKAWGGIALGMGNVAKRIDGGTVDPENPVASDPIFEIGRPDPALGIDPVGGMPVERGENALTIFRDGQTHFHNVVRVMPGGDVDMGTYQAKPSGVVYAE